MKKYIEAFIAKSCHRTTTNRMSAVLFKTLENVAYERAGKTPPYDDAEIFAELMSLKEEREETINVLSDDAALVATDLFEEWNPNKAYNKGDRFMWKGNLYRAKKDTVINPTWTPDIHEFYEPVAKPNENGTLDNPITAVAGMAYEKGKYYAENGKIYLCVRSDILYYLPSALVGNYFEEVGETNG